MQKPQMKTETGVCLAIEEARIISFNATPDVAGEFEQFGYFMDEGKHKPNTYSILVDSRYDFKEVLEYIKNYRPERRNESL